MSGATYFVQECPTCGRRLQVRVEYLGRHLVCQHCQGRFEAADSTGQSASDSSSEILLRAEELISGEFRTRPR